MHTDGSEPRQSRSTGRSLEWVAIFFLCVVPAGSRALWARVIHEPAARWSGVDVFAVREPLGVLISFGPLLVVLLCLLGLAEIRPTDLGVRFARIPRQVLEGVALWLADLAIVHAVTPIVPPTPAEIARVWAQVAPHGSWLALTLVGIPISLLGEELTRAYFVERTGPKWLGACVAIGAIGLTHLHLDNDTLLATTLGFGVLYTLYYLWRRSLVAVVVAHTCFNLGALVMSLCGEVRW